MILSSLRLMYDVLLLVLLKPSANSPPASRASSLFEGGLVVVRRFPEFGVLS